MKPFYILNYADDIRRERATSEEIESIAEGRSSDRLAHVELDADGQIVVRPLAEEEIRDLATQIEQDRKLELVALLDDMERVTRRGRRLQGVSPSSVVINAEDAPWAEAVVRAWAEDRSLEVHDEAPPAKPTKDWRRWVRVRPPGYWSDIAVLMFPAVDVGAVAIAVEAMCHGLAGVRSREAA
ncbi:MAG: hypothetical protein M3619_00780 [Myxococcota bacterium]|nr:hypothetical protein [Myxococcota bacterium]